MRYLLVILGIAILISCEKEQTAAGDGDPVEIYLLSKIELVSNRCEVNPSGSAINPTPIIGNDEILEYNKGDYRFKLTSQGIQKIKTLTDRQPFAVAVDKKVVYYGFFKPSISSSSCDYSITMDVAWGTNDQIMMRLGYPSLMQAVTIDDKRNDPTLLSALSKQNKLK